MSYLDNIINTDGWGDKKNSKIFELMKHNQEKFGYKNKEITPVSAPQPAQQNEVKAPVELKPYNPFEAKHKEQASKAA